MSITAGEPGRSWRDMYPSSTLDFCWFATFWEHQMFSRFEFCVFIIPFHLISAWVFWHFLDITIRLFSDPTLKAEGTYLNHSMSVVIISVVRKLFLFSTSSSQPKGFQQNLTGSKYPRSSLKGTLCMLLFSFNVFKNRNFDPAVQNYFIILPVFFNRFKTKKDDITSHSRTLFLVIVIII